MKFDDIFSSSKVFIPCIHLLALPGSPAYSGSMDLVFEKALEELEILKSCKIDGVIVENFRDKPFYPGRLPAETVAALAAVGREIVKVAGVPVGINALRNDGEAAMAIAASVNAQFIRVNVHMGAVVSEQGVIQGMGHLTLRLRAALQSKVLIFADVGVKHAASLADRGLKAETKDLAERGMADAIIVSGEVTGSETDADDVDVVRQSTDLPILIGSGATPENLYKVAPKVKGFIVGSYIKKDGKANNFVEKARVDAFARAIAGM